MVEQQNHNLKAEGSTPSSATKLRVEDEVDRPYIVALQAELKLAHEMLYHELERHTHWLFQSRELEEGNRFLHSQVATLKAEVEMLRIANEALTEMINLRKE